jgi:hypothetical protein
MIGYLVSEQVHCTTISFALEHCAAQTSLFGKYSVPNPAEHFFPSKTLSEDKWQLLLELVQQVMHVQLSNEKDIFIGV